MRLSVTRQPRRRASHTARGCDLIPPLKFKLLRCCRRRVRAHQPRGVCYCCCTSQPHVETMSLRMRISLKRRHRDVNTTLEFMRHRRVKWLLSVSNRRPTSFRTVLDTCNLKLHKYACITTYHLPLNLLVTLILTLTEEMFVDRFLDLFPHRFSCFSSIYLCFSY